MLKQFPEQYIEPTVNIIQTLSLTGKPLVLGSAADRTILYSADLDLNDNPVWSPELPRRLQKVIEKVEATKDVRITDFKAGVVLEWNLLEMAHLTKGVVLNYNHEKVMAHLESLYDRKIITDDEYKEAKPLIKQNPSPLEFLIAKKNMRFGLVRWTPRDIEAGFVKLRDGTTLSFSNALQQKTIVKLDIVIWIENRFVDCEILYNIIKNGNPINLATPEEVRQGIKESLLIFASEHNWMKVAKRMYSLAKLDKATTILDRLRDHIFNTDLGRLYSVLSDAKSLDDLREEGVTQKEKARIHQETDGFRGRLALVTLPPLLKPIDPFTKNFIEKLEGILQPRVKSTLVSLNLIPLPKKWLP
jgi:hypothetical protein